jgi:hypothetical protein
MNKSSWLAWFAALAVALTVAGCSTSASSSQSAGDVAPKAPTTSTAATTAPPPGAGSPTAAPQTSSPAGSPSAAPVPTVSNGTQLGTYTFDLTNGYAAPLSDTAPGQTQMVQVNSAGTCDVVYNGGLGTCNQEKIISQPNGSVPTYASCTGGTIFLDGVSAVQGTSFCIIETNGRVAGVTVASVGTSSAYVSLKVTVWAYVP